AAAVLVCRREGRAALAAFLLAAAAEELGWMGYAYAPLEARWGALGASLALGAFWAAWHVVPHLSGGRDAAWIAWWALGTVGVRGPRVPARGQGRPGRVPARRGRRGARLDGLRLRPARGSLGSARGVPGRGRLLGRVACSAAPHRRARRGVDRVVGAGHGRRPRPPGLGVRGHGAQPLRGGRDARLLQRGLAALPGPRLGLRPRCAHAAGRRGRAPRGLTARPRRPFGGPVRLWQGPLALAGARPPSGPALGA